jgi:hypothetical protein
VKLVVPAGFERGGGKAEPGRRLPEFRGWLEDVRTVLGPQVLDGLAPQRGVRLVPDRHVPPGQVLRIGVGHGFSPLSDGFVSPPMLRAGPRPGNSSPGMPGPARGISGCPRHLILRGSTG